jgi:20S proteasome subunit beta 7
MAAYGSMAKLRNTTRLHRINDQVAIGFSGDLADAQYVTRLLESVVWEDEVSQDGSRLSPKGAFNWLTRVYYNRRSKFDPLWNQVVVAGFDPATNEPFLGCVTSLGYSWQDSVVASGMGDYLAKPYMRTKQDANNNKPFTFQQAQQLVKQSMDILYARDKMQWGKYQVVNVDQSGFSKTEPQRSEIDWKVYSDFSEGRRV